VKTFERTIARVISAKINRARNRGGKQIRSSKMFVTGSGEIRVVIGIEGV
jgi:hypothetical protein